MSAKSKAAPAPASSPDRPPHTEQMKDVVRSWLRKHHPESFDVALTIYDEVGLGENVVKIIDRHGIDPMAALVAGARAVVREYPGAVSVGLVVTAGAEHVATVSIDPGDGPPPPGHDPLDLLAAGAWAVMRANPRADDAALVIGFGPNKEAVVVHIFPEEKRPDSLADLPEPRTVPPAPKKPARRKAKGGAR